MLYPSLRILGVRALAYGGAAGALLTPFPICLVFLVGLFLLGFLAGGHRGCLLRAVGVGWGRTGFPDST